MPPKTIELDKYGFPIPPGLDDEPKRWTGKPLFNARWWKIGLLLLIVGVGVVNLARSDFARRGVVDVLLMQAARQVEVDDLPGALWWLEYAQRCFPDEPRVGRLRAALLGETGDLAASLEAYNRVIEAHPYSVEPYFGRIFILQRLERHDDAVRDATRAIELSSNDDPQAWNSRAYVRAIAGRELKEGLEDVDQALRLAPDEPDYLDTRGYLLHLLGRQDEALIEMESAVAGARRQAEQYQRQIDRRRPPPSFTRRLLRQLDQKMAVMLHHRGLVYEALGRADEAAFDLEQAQRLGYDPAAGVF